MIHLLTPTRYFETSGKPHFSFINSQFEKDRSRKPPPNISHIFPPCFGVFTVPPVELPAPALFRAASGVRPPSSEATVAASASWSGSSSQRRARRASSGTCERHSCAWPLVSAAVGLGGCLGVKGGG